MTHSDNDDNILGVDIVLKGLTQEEADKLNDAVASLVKHASLLSIQSKDELAVYWSDEAERAKGTAQAVASSLKLTDKVGNTSDAYLAVKDAAVQYSLYKQAAEQLSNSKQTTKENLDRKPNEPIECYKARLQQYLNELE